MSATDVVSLVDLLEGQGINLWLDGGWGVDALLGEQTRPHDDLDVVLQNDFVPTLRRSLAGRGFRDVPRDDTSPWNFVLGDESGLEVDVHAIIFDAEGNGLYGPEEEGMFYSVESLTGTGHVNGRHVKCISAKWQVKFRTGYEVDEKDRHDIQVLSDRFRIEPSQEEQGKD